MKPITTNQEIILFTGTSFVNRAVCPIGNYKKQRPNPQITELEKACWAGMLFELLPELAISLSGARPFIWNIHSTNHFVLINQGAEPSTVEDAFSVDPYHFLDKIRHN